MSDSLTDLQGLIKTRINAATDLATLQVILESSGTGETSLDAAVRDDGVAAMVLFPDLGDTGTRDQCKGEFTVIVKELADGRSFTKDSAEIAIQIFNQLRKWKPGSGWQTVQNLRIDTIELEPYAVRSVSGETGIFLN